MKKVLIAGGLMLMIGAVSCKNKKSPQAEHQVELSKDIYTCPMPEDSVFSDKPGYCPKCGMNLVKMKPQSSRNEKGEYTCPMPEDSVFSDKPGSCPKCGMDLVKMEPQSSRNEKGEYTCPMPEDSVFSNQPGECPKCGMELVKISTKSKPADDLDMEHLLKPTNEFVLSSIPVTAMEKREEVLKIESLGTIAYDTRQVGSISSRVSGRIEKLYVRYRYQKVRKGQKILDLYSPELLTAQQNLLFLLKNDAANTAFIEAARDKLVLLGMSGKQLDQVIQSGTPTLTLSVYSEYSGHVHESAIGGRMNTSPGSMKDLSLITEELSLREGMYVQKGQSVFTVFNPDRAWAILDIFGDNQSLVKTGNAVWVVPETAPDKNFRAAVDFIEPFYRKERKTRTARVYFNNSVLNIPVGSPVRATIFGNTNDAYWLPKEAVLSLGMDKVVFQKTDGGFVAKKISTGILYNKQVQIVSGLATGDSVAVNAQFLMDSESFIKIKN